ncbi:Disintegrin and metalloproteinase domain-containing protein 9 [Stylophora pistillata]|uniref:Disintegrin and metalloproteinase domain-containing protein 9 n=1 Tax=Stylophora pistillata TaxID=50429 RepID=A0A2B4RAW4_STYPI|nr:Disintegrin and metalloproteinase domain-containing protein 9 [Stylophora pistillata]
MLLMKVGSWLVICTLWFLLHTTSTQFADEAYQSDYHITFPERIDGRRERRDLSTSEKGGHVDDVSYRVNTPEKDWTLDIKRNKELTSPSFAVRTFANDGSEVIHEGVSDHCHYQGFIRGLADSTVVLNTCSGLRGLIDDGKDTFYITPESGREGTGAHRVFQAREDKAKHILNNCGNKETHADLHYLDEKSGAISRIRRSISGHIDEFYKPFMTTDETRYNELLLVVDFGMYLKHNNDTKVITDRVITLTNAVDAIYQRINIRVVLKALEIWTNGDPFERQNKGGPDLGRFTSYRNDHLVKKFPHENAQLLSEWRWSDCIGMAFLFGMCGSVSTGVNNWDYGSIIGPYVVLAHEMGHNFGFSHDEGSCKCLTPRGCIMGGHNYCGNGIREEGEECDCGTPEYKKQGSLCRGVKTDCDVPEYCTGNSRDCPEDSYIIDGYPCNQTKTTVQGNTNFHSVNHRTLNPRVHARYLRINPQYWYGWPCLRTEFLGCSAGEVSPTAPTPLKSYGLDLCLTPTNQSCSPNDNDRLIYRPGECSESHFQFTLAADGVLRHSCSGKMVCPENGGTGNGAKIVVSSTCKTEDSKFERTSARSLKHLKTGKCVHTNGAWPGVDRHMVLWSGCDEKRLELWFAKQECVDPLGMQSGDIKDNQITASSSRPADLPHYGRLHNKKYWCAKEKNKNEYIQVDLGQERTVNSILIQGRGNWYDWVTGFFLFYSDDGQRWTGYSESGDKQHSNAREKDVYLLRSELLILNCKPNSSNFVAAKNADLGCYDKLNTEAAGYGTCDPVTNSSCNASDVLCGQLQCEDSRDTPVVDYGWTYTKISLDNGKQCSAATLKSIDDLGEGMVREGTKCGDDKMCISYRCQSFDSLNIGKCPVANNKECGGRGVCTNKKLCHCVGGFDSKDGCASALVPREGAWGEWSSWTVCDKGCDSGKRRRHRFCDNPFPLHGGADCLGERHETDDCNTQSCPVVISCHHLRQVGDEQNHLYPDGVYKIYPTGSQPIMAYCDMSRDGGGWTLLVTSHTNTWTTQNLKLRNANSPKVTDDYSILQFADSIKDNINVAGSTFEYRLEAQSRGRWGGIWEAPRGFTFTANNNKQTNVELVKKFDNWEYSDSGIEQRMPWISDARLTTSHHAYRSWWGTITADAKEYHPAPWIAGHLMERQPSYIWYWMREGPYKIPGSCKEVFFRGLLTNPVSDGVFTIRPPGQHEVKTVCDFTTEGGPWTLLVTSKTHSGWDKDNVKERNSDNPSLQDDYSILGLADAIKDFDKAQEFFHYRIEADSKNRWGGIWEAPRDYTFLSTCDKQTKVKLVKKFDSWDENSNLGKRMPRLGLSNNLLLASASTVDEPSGSLVHNSGASSASYLEQEKPNPSVVRYWMREGARLSCNDLKLHGVRAGNKYDEDSFQLMKVSDAQYLPVYCDMTTAKGAFTLIVTSAHNNWTREQVPRRNTLYPGLNRDYSILDLADSIKSLNNNGTFQYMMDAHSRRHWGGIFEAPTSYSFMASDSSQTHVNLTRKFDNWEYSWWNSLNKRMPWFDAKGTHNMALLTTSYSPTHYPSGSIIWGGPDRFPSDWIWAGGMRNPGVIWYWLNEDDCDEDRKPVNGGLTEWGEWGRCDELCEPGKQQRYKTCTNPKRRCGGKQCDPNIATQDERNCVYCPESGIRSYGDFCVAPNEGGCSPPDGSYLIFTKKEGMACNATDQIFVLDQDGVIHHKCSKKVVCPQDNNPTYYKKLMLKDKCDLSISRHMRLPAHNNLKNLKHNFCVHPKGGWPGEGVYLNYWPGCGEERLKLNFFKLGAASA